MTIEDASAFVSSRVAVTREDVARAKTWILRHQGANVGGMADEWLRQQNISEIRAVDTDSPDCSDVLLKVATAIGLRRSFFTATWELINSGLVVPAGGPDSWHPKLEYRTPRYAGPIPLNNLDIPHPSKIVRLWPVDEPADVDIFLEGVHSPSLDPGIREGVSQSLICFRRGLYLPATVMLGAAAEGTWIECGRAIATRTANPALATLVDNPLVGIAKAVSEIRKTLELSSAKPLLKASSRTIHHVRDAELWMTALRERRNALHWGKAKSFLADHAETGTLLMAAPQHLATLEAIKAAC